MDNIDLRAAQQSGIVVNNAVGINSNAVAESSPEKIVIRRTRYHCCLV
ncbi:hypothetical protein [Enterobacter hormaechei]